MSNEWTGSRSSNRKSLHHIGDGFNPYKQAITIIGKTLAAIDEDKLIPSSTHDQDVFSFYLEERFSYDFEEVWSRYQKIVPHLKLAGPTSLALVIEKAMTTVEQSARQYHVLLISNADMALLLIVHCHTLKSEYRLGWVVTMLSGNLIYSYTDEGLVLHLHLAVLQVIGACTRAQCLPLSGNMSNEEEKRCPLCA